jgi:integrase
MEYILNELIDSPAILKRVEGQNHGKKIKIRYKPRGTKGYSLYLDLWYEGRRHYEFLKLYILGEPDSIQQDKETLKRAGVLRDRKEIELFQKQTGFELTYLKRETNFIDYFSQIVDKKSHHNWRSCLKHLTDYAGASVIFKQVDTKFCEEFAGYLMTKVDQNTAHSYFDKLRAGLNIAMKENMISHNPAKDVTIKTTEAKREFLTEEELTKVMHSPAADREVKNAFIFSCFTGLRISDIRNLTFDQIKDGNLYFRQKKTKGLVNAKLPPNAMQIIETQIELRRNSEDNKIFLLPLDAGTINKVIRNWMSHAGIKKEITYHCSRHTYATMCLTFNMDIYTVSKLLGHRDIKTTEIYAKIIDKKRDSEIDKLPVIQ